MLESPIKTKCRIALEKSGWYVVHVIQSNKNGIPDTIITRGGVTIWIEFKRTGVGIKKEGLQEYRKKELEKHGATHMVVSDFSQITHLL